MSNILIIDDDDELRRSFSKLLREEGFQVHCEASGEAGLEALKSHRSDLVVLDVRLPGMNGLQTLAAIHAMEPKLPVIIMTAYGTTETAIEATKQGAFEYILKPFEIPEMLLLIKQALDAGRFMRSPVGLNVPPHQIDGEAMIGNSAAMQRVYKNIGRVAATDATVLIRGESGTGKELAARAIYHYSDREAKPFLVINCVAIPETLLESELFGYEKGAFTGASHRRVGKIEQANGGTIFLDEIGDMPLSLQAKLLRLLQERSIERLGGRETIPVNVRIIAATNRDLEEMIQHGRFREDLYFRLKVISIWLPPLRERIDDIDPLVAYFVGRHAAELSIAPPGFAKETMQVLRSMPWPGNVRELANTLKKALIFNRGAPMRPQEIRGICQNAPEVKLQAEENLEQAMRKWVQLVLEDSDGDSLFEESMDRFASIMIEETLGFTIGNRSKAAKLLGMSRPTLHAKIEKFGLKIGTSVTKPPL